MNDGTYRGRHTERLFNGSIPDTTFSLPRPLRPCPPCTIKYVSGPVPERVGKETQKSRSKNRGSKTRRRPRDHEEETRLTNLLRFWRHTR